MGVRCIVSESVPCEILIFYRDDESKIILTDRKISTGIDSVCSWMKYFRDKRYKVEFNKYSHSKNLMLRII